MAASMPETNDAASTVAREHDSVSAALLPLCCDEVYMLGLPWDPWPTCDCDYATAGDPTFMPAIMMATRRLCTRLWLAAERLAARIAG